MTINKYFQLHDNENSTFINLSYINQIVFGGKYVALNKHIHPYTGHKYIHNVGSWKRGIRQPLKTKNILEFPLWHGGNKSD